MENKMFIVRSFKDRIEAAKKLPPAKMLFSELWHEYETCILFAPTNVGKSVLAVQIANSIASGIEIKGFPLEASPQKVIYIDFELSDRQFYNRYDYEFSENCLCATLDFVPEKSVYFEQLQISIENMLVENNAKVLILDNLTACFPLELEKSQGASPILNFLKRLKDKHSVATLLVAHTPKRNSLKSLELNDLQGSSTFSSLIDSVFAIGSNVNYKNIKYIKQLKARNEEFIHASDNVAVCQLVKKDNFLQFEYLRCEEEELQLTPLSKEVKASQRDKVHELKNQGLSNVKIAEQLGITEKTVRNWLKHSNNGNENGTI